MVVVVIEAAELLDVEDSSRRLTWGCQDAREGCHQTCVLCPCGVVVRDQVQHVWVSQLAASASATDCGCCHLEVDRATASGEVVDQGGRYRECRYGHRIILRAVAYKPMHWKVRFWSK